MKTIRTAMPTKHWQAMNQQNPHMPGMVLKTRRESKGLNPPTMHFYYGRNQS
jgi:hypothetical protein